MRLLLSWLWPLSFASTIHLFIAEYVPTLHEFYFKYPLWIMGMLLLRTMLIDIYGQYMIVTYNVELIKNERTDTQGQDQEVP